MKSYLSLIPRSARVHKKQNRLTLICIVLAVFLVTVIFSITDVWFSSEKESLIKRHGNYHIILNDVPVNDAELIGMQNNVSASSWYSVINYASTESYFINNKTVVLNGAEKPYFDNIRNFPIEGAYPYNDTEIMLSGSAKELDINIDDNITLNTPSGDFEYTISGFCDDTAELKDRSNEIIYAYMNMTGLDIIRSTNNSECKPQYYIQFTEKTKIKQWCSICRCAVR